ncbi:MAG: DUF4349 domain-containing protein [Dehalococcoidales bacterium]|nr:DUF4349 domain-containing protein [Dehalococcoidales bacterium]
MKKWFIVISLLVVGVMLLTSCAKATTAYETPQTYVYSQSSSSGIPAPEITVTMPASPSPIRSAFGLDSPSNIAESLFGGGKSAQSYPAYYDTSSTGSSGSPGRATTPMTVTTTTTAASTTAAGSQPMIVRTGQVDMVVNDITAAIAQITQLTNDNSGYVVSNNKYSNDKIYSGVISIRVPAAQFDGMMNSLRAMAVKVTTETSSATDVTQEYTDLSSRLKNLEAAEAQLVEILTRAGTVTEVLEVQKQLTSTREEIEVIKGRMQYLEQTAAMSLISINLRQSSLVLNLVAGTRNARAGDNINFAASIQGGISPYSYAWDFGDGAKSTDESPWHKYTSSGLYTVSLVVTDDNGNKATDTRAGYINITPGWNAGDVAKGTWQGFLSVLKFLFTVLLWLVYLAPFAAIIFGIVFLVKRARRNRRMKLAAAQENEVKTE